MVNNLVSLFILTITFSGQARNLATEAVESKLQVRQIPNTMQELRSYFRDYTGIDTLFAIINPVGNCPRCEGILTPIFDELKRLHPDIPTVLISVSSDSYRTSDYLRRHPVKADYYKFDDKDDYRHFLSFSAGTLHIPYLMKIVPSNGEMIVGMEAASNDTGLLRDFCQWTVPLKKTEFHQASKYITAFYPPKDCLQYRRTMKLQVPDTIVLSQIVGQPEFHNDRLYFNDKLNEAIEVFGVSGDEGLRFIREFRTDSVQNRTFVKVRDDIYTSLLHADRLRFIPLSPKVMGDSLVVIGYSLPHIWEVEENHIGYGNQSCMVLTDRDLSTSELIPFSYEDGDEFFYPHFNIYPYGNAVATGCRRLTWPMDFDKEDYEGYPTLNPFSAEYYHHEQPTIAVFDMRKGNLLFKTGELPDLSEKTLTGSYFVQPVVDTWQGWIAVSDGFSGIIKLLDSRHNTEEETSAFTIPQSLIAPPDSTLFYSYECVTQYEHVFNRSILDIKQTSSHVYVLVKYTDPDREANSDDRYSVIRINRECDCREERSYPISDGYHAYGLRRNGEDLVELYEVEGKDGDWNVILYDFD